MSVIMIVLFAFVMHRVWKANIFLVLLFAVPYCVIGLAFLGAVSIKIPHGGTVPLCRSFAFLIVSQVGWRSLFRSYSVLL